MAVAGELELWFDAFPSCIVRIWSKNANDCVVFCRVTWLVFEKGMENIH